MKKLSLITVALAAAVIGPALLAGSAVAADVGKAPPMAVSGAYNWAGWYVGLNAGYAWGDSHVSTLVGNNTYFAATSITSIAANTTATIRPNGFTGGGQIGYNIQSGNYVAGLEAAFVAFDLKGSRSTGAVTYPCCAPTNYTINQNVKSEWLFTFGPRAGVTMNNWLFFSSMGLAVSEFTTGFTFTDTFAAASASASRTDTRLGFTSGGGVEVGLSRNWTIRAEYQWVYFGSMSVASNNMIAFGAANATNFLHSANLSANIVRGAINYKF